MGLAETKSRRELKGQGRLGKAPRWDQNNPPLFPPPGAPRGHSDPAAAPIPAGNGKKTPGKCSDGPVQCSSCRENRERMLGQVLGNRALRMCWDFLPRRKGREKNIEWFLVLFSVVPRKVNAQGAPFPNVGSEGQSKGGAEAPKGIKFKIFLLW